MLVAASDDGAGQDRDHGQHAGREGKQQPDAEGAKHDQYKFCCINRGLGRRDRISAGNARGQAGGEGGHGQHPAAGRRHAECFGGGRVADRDTLFRTALVGRLECKPHLLVAQALYRQTDIKPFVVHLGLADKLIDLDLAARQLVTPEPHTFRQRSAVQSREFKVSLVAIEVTAVGDLKTRAQSVFAKRLHQKGERLFRVHHFLYAAARVDGLGEILQGLDFPNCDAGRPWRAPCGRTACV